MKIAVIGGAGFIGSYITRDLLQAGHEVRVSAYQPQNQDKYAHLFRLPGAKERLRLVPLDLLDADAVPRFIEGCEAVIHSGTPFQLNFGDPVKELIEPTVKGTQHLLRALAAAPTVRKLVVIASVAAHNTSFPLDPPTRSGTLSEADEPYFSTEDHPYAQGKYLADRAVREFIEDYSGACEIVTLSPVGVFGAALSDREDSTSVGIQHLFKNKIAPDPFVQMMFDQDVPFAVVGVQDVAKAAVAAVDRSGLHGRHFLLSAESRRVSDLGRILNGEAPTAPPTTVYDNAASRRDLGMVYATATDFMG